MTSRISGPWCERCTEAGRRAPGFREHEEHGWLCRLCDVIVFLQARAASYLVTFEMFLRGIEAEREVETLEELFEL